jgi:rfaE bifunctional protein nucleotidyltransferase chain/domain
VTPPPRPVVARVVDLSRLREILSAARDARRSIVFTNGCFDLLHAGHVALLESSAQSGDVLVVGLNSDESVSRLKGFGRPFVPFEERAELLAGLAAVDWVIGFDDDTPAALIEVVRPDILVKGGDWSLDRIVGRETVESRGGRVVTVPLRSDLSTTSLVDRIRSS